MSFKRNDGVPLLTVTVRKWSPTGTGTTPHVFTDVIQYGIVDGFLRLARVAHTEYITDYYIESFSVTENDSQVDVRTNLPA